MAITHPFVSAKADGADATLVRPSNWNADHVGTDNIADGRAKSATVTYLSVPGVGLLNTTTQLIAVDRIYYGPMLTPTAITLDQIIIEVITAGAAGKVIRLGIYNADTDWQPTTLVLDAGTVAVDSTGVKTITINQALSAGRYLLALWSNGTPTVRIIRGSNRFGLTLDTLGATPLVQLLYVGATYSTYPSTGTAWDTIGTGGTSFIYIVFVRVSTP